jgi:hypothetical protein
MNTPLILLAILATPPSPEGSADYLRDVKPVLERRCYACHGALKQKSGLRLDTADLIRKGGESGPAIEVGQASDSLLIEALTGNGGLRMPPEGEPLGGEEIEAIKRWIDAGAPSPSDERPQEDPRRHWSFQPPSRPEVPTVRDPEWARNPIDAFLAAEHERRGLTPRPMADKATLLRRASLDLTGLAPTRPELQAFLADDSSDAYEKAVDRLLASPRYGERWGRHWMDVWRYSDWAGYQKEVRESQPHIWRWRDWIIESLNDDKGYDRMLSEMLAGDELAPDDPETLRATGYLVRNWYKFNRHVWLQNTVDHTAKAFLGLTLGCARCHDHKYDPIAQTDYYRFRAFFEAHEVRTDRVPGQPDTTKDGLPRVYDAHADAKTFLFARGDDKRPDEKHPLTPGLPGIWPTEVAVEPVALSPTAYYPGVRAQVQAETIAQALAALEKAEEARVQAIRALDAAKVKYEAQAAAPKGKFPDPEAASAFSALAKARGERAVAEAALSAATADRDAARARVAADIAKYQAGSDPKTLEALAREAGGLERKAALLKAEHTVASTEFKFSQARSAPKPEEAKAKQALAAAEKAATEARQALDKARADSASTAASYASIGSVYPTTSTGRRTALARWVSGRENPLTARVAVNHIWMRHFGSPLVSTVFDFGLNGKKPSHPPLLDWLAVELMDRGWSMKALHRLIVTSRAYRLESFPSPNDPNLALDPTNAYLWRMNARRMEAEVVRDNVLHASGNLDLAIGGPEIDQNSGFTSNRRSVYFRHAPEKVMTFLKVFDAANMNACYRREESIVPQQALALANSPLALAQTRLLAKRLSDEVGPSGDPVFVSAAFEAVLGRGPTPEERAACEAFLVSQAKILADPGSKDAFAGPAVPVAASAEPPQRARENLVHVLINHNDFVTIR